MRISALGVGCEGVRSPAVPRLSSWVVGLIGLITLLLWPASGRAESTTIIDISDGFPSEELPLGDPFVLERKVGPEVKDAFGVFFEYAYGAFGSKAGSALKHCSEARSFLRAVDAKLTGQSTGELGLAEILELEPMASIDSRRKWTDLKKRPAFFLPAWHASKTETGDPNPVHLRVPKTSFFKRGAHYCLMLIERSEHEKESKAVLELINDAQDAISTCIEQNPAASGPNCAQAAFKRIELAKLTMTAAAKAALIQNLGPGAQLALARHRLKAAYVAAASHPPPLDPTAANTALLALFTEVLKADKQACTLPAGTLTRIVAHGLDKVDAITTAAGKETTTVCDNSKLLVSAGVTMNDVLALANKAVIVNGELVSFASLAIKAEDKAPFTKPAPFVIDWEAVNQRLAIFNFLTANEPARPPAGVEKRKAFRNWANTIDSAWTTAASGRGPEMLLVKTSDYVAALKAWDPELAKVKEILASSNIVAVDVSLGLNPRTWIFSFITPTVGYATTADSFGIPTLALQLYLFPNSADEPMWTNGVRDLRRVLSVELGVAPKTKQFGPDDRYSGPGELPPLLAGVGVHLIPYTTLSGGALFVDAKRTTLAAERAELHPLFYFSASVQTNVPDIISALVSGKVTATE